jgi:hypothetical protein
VTLTNVIEPVLLGYLSKTIWNQAGPRNTHTVPVELQAEFNPIADV